MAIEKGQSFSAQEEVDKYRAIIYGGASGDFNPIHIDPEFGKLVGLGGNILQGLCTLGFTANTIIEWMQDPGKLKKLKCRFSVPVMMLDNLTIKGEVAEIVGDRAILSMHVAKQAGIEVLTKVIAEIEV